MSRVILQLEQPSLEDDIREQKKALLEERGCSLSFEVTPQIHDYSGFVDKVLLSARIIELNEKEWYFMEEDDESFSPRNKLEALHTVESLIRQLKHERSGETRESLENLHATVVRRLENFGPAEVVNELVSTCSGGSEAALSEWAARHGVKSKLQIAVFEGIGRGVAATCNIDIGDIALEIPEELIISDNCALHSDLGSAVAGMGLSGETIAMLWSMRERDITNSKFAPFFGALPETFNTGLSLGFRGLQALQGTLLLQEILQAKEHLQSQYDSLFPELSTQYPDVFPEAQFTWEQFLWTAELWYSYGMKVLFPDGALKTCLVPMASLLNHSVYPHITHYSRVDPATRSLRLSVVRPCKAGSQCYLSYGPLSNQELLLFYGFTLKENPYDTIPIEFEASSSLDVHGLGPHHMIRGTWLSSTNSRDCGLPSRLLAALRVLCEEESGSSTLEGNPRLPAVDSGVEEAALGTLLQTVEALLEEMGEGNGPVDHGDDEVCDMVKVAANFVESQRRLLESVRASCLKLMSLR